jgi:hypothetical protein
VLSYTILRKISNLIQNVLPLNKEDVATSAVENLDAVVGTFKFITTMFNGRE